MSFGVIASSYVASAGAVGTPQIGAVTERNAETSTNVPYPATVNAGDLCILFGQVTTTSTTPVTLPSGWTLVDMVNVAGGGSMSLFCAIQYATGSEGGTSQTVAHTNSTSSWQILAFPGVDQTTAQDVAHSAVNQTAALTCDIPGVTVATAGAALIAIACKNSTSGTDTGTPPTGFTETADRVTGTRPTLEASYKLGQGAGATGTETVTFTVSARSIGFLVALRPA